MKRTSWRGVSLLAAIVAFLPWLSAADSMAGDITFRYLARKYFKDGEGTDLAKLIGFNQPVKEVIALEYKVLLFADGKETAVDPKLHAFRLGDRIRLAIEPLSDCYVYIYHIGSSGKGAFLLPAEGEQPFLAKAGTAVPLPPDGFFKFDEPPGKETVTVVATGSPVADRDVLASVLSKKPEEKFTPQEDKVRKTIKATVTGLMQSAREKQEDKLYNKVTFRGLARGEKFQEMVKGVLERGTTEGTFEEPSRNGAGGTCAMYISSEKHDDPRLVVTIPLLSGTK